jgi:ankyrin repeat protein
VVDLLISVGIDVNQVDNKGRTPLDWTLWQNDFASALRARGAKTSKEM